MLLLTDWTLLRLFPPLRAMWAAIGTQAQVVITGQNARRVLFGTINVRTARRTITIGRNAGAHEVRAFLLALRKAYRRAGTIWLLAAEPADIPRQRCSRWPRNCRSNLSGC